MQNLPEFLEKMFGESWRTATLGLVLVILSLPVFGVGAGLLAFGQSEVGGVVLGQGGIMLAGGVGFMMTRDNAASKKAVKEINQQIATTAQIGSEEHADNAQRLSKVEAKVETVKEVVKEVAPSIAREKL